MSTHTVYQIRMAGVAMLVLLSTLVVAAPSFAAAPPVAQVASGELTAGEVAGLLYMREEEKLAHDVYAVLYDKWNVPVFDNIAASENRHVEAVLTLMDSYSLADPARSNEPGQFSNPELQALFDELVGQGGQSLADALFVGAAIEEIDILDLAEYVNGTDRQDVQWVYGNLMEGSENHLRAFVRNLERRTGEVYQPQYLSQQDYDTIINAT